jgi:hypothetical protein
LIFVEERRGEERRGEAFRKSLRPALAPSAVEVMGGGRRNGEGFSDSVRSCAEI